MFETLELFDRKFFLAINSRHTDFLDNIMWQMSKDWPTVVFGLIFAYFFYKNFQFKNMASLLLGVALVLACTDLSTNLIKHQVKRYRPSHNLEIKEQVHLVNEYKGGTYGFYSSHAANAFGLITFFYLSAGWISKRKKILFFLYPAIVGFSRVYLGVHYPSDILVGAINGLIFGTLIFYIINTYFYKFSDVKV